MAHVKSFLHTVFEIEGNGCKKVKVKVKVNVIEVELLDKGREKVETKYILNEHTESNGNESIIQSIWTQNMEVR